MTFLIAIQFVSHIKPVFITKLCTVNVNLTGRAKIVKKLTVHQTVTQFPKYVLIQIHAFVTKLLNIIEIQELVTVIQYLFVLELKRLMRVFVMDMEIVMLQTNVDVICFILEQIVQII